MTGWGESRVLTIDVESTGIDVAQDRIVTACAAIVDPSGEIAYKRSWLLAVEVDIPEAASAVHGISTDHARTNGVPVKQGIREFAGAVKFAVRAGMSVLAFNMPFDASMLDAECVRTLGVGLAEYCGGPITPVIDPLCVDKAVDRYRPGSRKLVDTAALYGVGLGDDAHDATADAIAAARVAFAMWQRSQLSFGELRDRYADRRYPDRLARDWQALGRLSATALHELQIEWYREQAESFAQYLRQQANEQVNEARKALNRDDSAAADEFQREADALYARADGVDVEWPMRSLTSAKPAKTVAA